MLTGVSNMRLRGQSRPSKDSKLAHWAALENANDGLKFGLWTVFMF